MQINDKLRTVSQFQIPTRILEVIQIFIVDAPWLFLTLYIVYIAFYVIWTDMSENKLIVIVIVIVIVIYVTYVSENIIMHYMTWRSFISDALLIWLQI